MEARKGIDRKDFLKRTVAGAAGIAFAGTAGASLRGAQPALFDAIATADGELYSITDTDILDPPVVRWKLQEVNKRRARLLLDSPI